MFFTYGLHPNFVFTKYGCDISLEGLGIILKQILIHKVKVGAMVGK
jgi:hypothetical protein